MSWLTRVRNALPFGTVVRYQKRPSSSQVGRTPVPVTSGVAFAPRNRSARA